MSLRLVVAAVVVGAAAGAAAQQSAVEQFWRWTDNEGRTHITDTPPPPGAKNVRRPKSAAADEKADAAAGKPGAKPDPAVPFAVQRAISEYPVVLYTAPNCSQPCSVARDLLNKRGVPFSEVQVYDEPGVAELKRISGQEEVPVIKVGASVYAGFQRTAYDSLLDSAGYPAVGILPSRAQAAPAPPEGYTLNPTPPPKAAPLTPDKPAAAGSGPYSPK